VVAATALACGGGDQTLDDVRALQDSGAYAETLAPLRELLEATPSDPEANYRLGLALVNTGRATAAVFPLKRAATDPSMARQAGLLLATTFSQMRNFEEAITAADGVLQTDPENEAALLVRAQAALGANDAPRALESAERLIAVRPDDPGYKSLRAGSLMALGRFDEAEKLLGEIEGVVWPNDPSGEGKTCLVIANFYGKFRGGAERAAPKIRECLERYKDDPSLLPLAADSYDAIKRPDDATLLMRHALEKSPEDQGLRMALAHRMLTRGEREAGEKMMEEVARASGNPKSWLQLAGLRRKNQDPEGALEALDEALALSPASEEFKFGRADVLIDLGRLDEAEAVASGLEDPTFARIVRGRLALERGDAKEALAQLGPAIEQWPTNAGARILAARAAYELGDEARALSELREATRSEPAETDAALLLARFYYARGDYDQAAEFAWRHIKQRKTSAPAAHRIGIWSHLAKGKFESARAFLEDLREGKTGDFSGVALAEEAQLVAREKGADAAIRLLREKGAALGAPAYEPALRTLVELDRAAGRQRQASELVDGLAAKRPDSAGLQALRGELRLAAGDRTSAAAAFAEALQLDPHSAAALAGQARVARSEGRAAEAVALFERAAAETSGNAQYEFEAAQALLASGDAAGGRKRLEALLPRHPEHAGAANDLAWLLASMGEDLDRALQLAERASRLLPGHETLDTLGYVHLQRGELADAVGAFERALEADPGYGTARYHLGLTLAKKGDRDAALAALRGALESGPFPEADQARTELAKLEGVGGAN
jgi:tetratricopeptide (TPR) repeat protein